MALKRIATLDIQCSPEQMSHSYEGNIMHRISGCGRSNAYELRCDYPICIWVEDVRGQAQEDLGCPWDQLQVQKTGKSAREVSGCGQRAEFGLISRSGRWLLVKRLEPAPPGTVSRGAP